MDSFDELRELVAQASRRLARDGLSPGSSSNVSARAGDHVAVTATGLVLAEATAQQITVVDLGGKVVAGDLAPTSEVDLHLGIYASSPAGAVVHTHAPNATALGLVRDQLPVIHYEQLLLGGSIQVAPFATFGTPELAEHVRHALSGRKAALMANHGCVTWGTDMRDALRNAALLEWLCGLYLRAASLGEPKTLTSDEQAAVIEHAMRTKYGKTRSHD